MAAPRSPRDSVCVMTEMVLPNDTNPLGNLMGGRLLHLMDICTAIAAQRHSNRIVVTVSVDFVEFEMPIKLGEVVVMEAVVNRAFSSSMEVQVDVWAENPMTRTRKKSNRAFYTFVAVDQNGQPIPVPPILPTTGEEQERFESAARRRELRLILGGRLALADAEHLRDYVQSLIPSRSPN